MNTQQDKHENKGEKQVISSKDVGTIVVGKDAAKANGGAAQPVRYQIEDNVPIPSPGSRGGITSGLGEQLAKLKKDQAITLTVELEGVKDFPALKRRAANGIHNFKQKGTGAVFATRTYPDKNTVKIWCKTPADLTKLKK